jgi:hypothetical protein
MSSSAPGAKDQHPILSQGMIEALQVTGLGNDGQGMTNAILKRRAERQRRANYINREMTKRRGQLRDVRRWYMEKPATKPMSASEAFDLGLVSEQDLADRWQRQAAKEVRNRA